MARKRAGPGPRNLITDIAGVAVGNAEDRRARTGVTVVLPDRPAVAAVAVTGGAPGTRETDLLGPTCLVERVDAIVLAGGSAFGLEAASGVVAWLAERHRGFRVRQAVVPIVPAAILFDLLNGGDKGWGHTPPYRRLGERAVAASRRDFALGNVGAGYGARAGVLKGGLGSASYRTRDGFTVGALAAVNCFGNVLIPNTRHFWAAALEQGGEYGGFGPPPLPPRIDLDAPAAKPPLLAANTTIAVVATDARLTKAEAGRVAIMAQDGLARAVRPAHTPFDGDTVFVLATGRHGLKGPADLSRVGALAADCLARAIARGVYAADSLGGMPGYRLLHDPEPARRR
ncbi:MAG: P1 family peptidase [Proteobacteria bacterium]|nr:P1 family peptidase [Pseudomonadota bacterium]